MKAQYLSKSGTWKLSNGWKAKISYTWQGIRFVSKLTSPDGKKYWHCSSGLDFRKTYVHAQEVINIFEGLGQIPLPDFAKPFAGKVKDFKDKPINNLVAVFFDRQ